jgi:hypothetical protein
MKILNMEIPDWLVLVGVAVIVYELGRDLEDEPQEPILEGDVMTCAAWQALQTEKGPIIRCMYYEPTCADGTCRSEPVPYPPSIMKMIEEREPPRKKRKTRKEEEAEFDKEVKIVAQMMAKDENDFLEEGKELYRKILAHGGIRPQRSFEEYGLKRKGQRGPEYEEYMGIPKYLHRKKGMTADDMASEMGYGSEAEFLEDIEADRLRRSKLPKGRRYWKISDFMAEAEKYLIGQQRAA